MYVVQLGIIAVEANPATQDELVSRLKANLMAQAVEARGVTIEQFGRQWRLHAEVEFLHLVVVVCNEALELFRQVFPQGYREVALEAAV